MYPAVTGAIKRLTLIFLVNLHNSLAAEIFNNVWIWWIFFECNESSGNFKSQRLIGEWWVPSALCAVLLAAVRLCGDVVMQIMFFSSQHVTKMKNNRQLLRPWWNLSHCFRTPLVIGGSAINYILFAPLPLTTAVSCHISFLTKQID